MAAAVVSLFVPSRPGTARVIVVAAPTPAAHGVGEALLGADVGEEARREAAAEDLVHDLEGVVVGVVARGARVHHADVALGDVVLRRRSRRPASGRLIAAVGLGDGAGPWARSRSALRSLRLHGLRIEVAPTPQDDVVRVDVAPCHATQVVARHGAPPSRTRRCARRASPRRRRACAPRARRSRRGRRCGGRCPCRPGPWPARACPRGTRARAAARARRAKTSSKFSLRQSKASVVESSPPARLDAGRRALRGSRRAASPVRRLRAARAPRLAVEARRSPTLLRGSSREPPGSRAKPWTSGSSWSSCRKTTSPFGSATAAAAAGRKARQRAAWGSRCQSAACARRPRRAGRSAADGERGRRSRGAHHLRPLLRRAGHLRRLDHAPPCGCAPRRSSVATRRMSAAVTFSMRSTCRKSSRQSP